MAAPSTSTDAATRSYPLGVVVDQRPVGGPARRVSPAGQHFRIRCPTANRCSIDRAGAVDPDQSAGAPPSASTPYADPVGGSSRIESSTLTSAARVQRIRRVPAYAVGIETGSEETRIGEDCPFQLSAWPEGRCSRQCLDVYGYRHGTARTADQVRASEPMEEALWSPSLSDIAVALKCAESEPVARSRIVQT